MIIKIVDNVLLIDFDSLTVLALLMPGSTYVPQMSSPVLNTIYLSYRNYQLPHVLIFVVFQWLIRSFLKWTEMTLNRKWFLYSTSLKMGDSTSFLKRGSSRVSYVETQQWPTDDIIRVIFFTLWKASCRAKEEIKSE